MSQMPIGKYIYCTQHTSCGLLSRPVTNTYRQVHLLYRKIMEEVTVKNYQESQMPIGKYIYCTTTNAKLADGSSSQMPIGKYIYCTLMIAMGVTPKDLSQMPIGKYIYCTECPHNQRTIPGVTNAYRQVHLLYHLITYK